MPKLLHKGKDPPRINADKRGSEKQKLPVIHTEDTDQEGVGKMLPEPMGGAVLEGFAS
jgi:hypothetical protein